MLLNDLSFLSMLSRFENHQPISGLDKQKDEDLFGFLHSSY
jgi:hypothetical protein